MVSVPAAMPAVHEQMQHGAQEEQHIRQDTEHVRPVFYDEEERGNGKKRQEDLATRRPEPGPYPG
jgi:hypothetical protein